MTSAETDMHRAYDSIAAVLATIEENADDLALTPVGRSWLESASAVRELMGDGPA